MGTDNDRILESLFLDAESRGQFLVQPGDLHIRRALAYRVKQTVIQAHAKERRHTLHGLRVISPCNGIYARESRWNALTPSERIVHVARAFSQMQPCCIFDGFTAAAIRGWDVDYSLLNHVQVVSPYHRKTQSICVRTCRDASYDIIDGLRIATVGQTLFQCLQCDDLRLSLPIADSALRKLNLTKDTAHALIAEDEAFAHRRYRRRVLATIELANPLSESGGESVARATMLLLGFAAPELQVVYQDPVDPSHTFRVDFRWICEDGTEIIGENDGKQKYSDTNMTHGKSALEILTAERIRESRLTTTGARIVRFSYQDVRDVTYFEHLLSSYGVPRDPIPIRHWKPLALEPARDRNGDSRSELPPLSCYADLLS